MGNIFKKIGKAFKKVGNQIGNDLKKAGNEIAGINSNKIGKGLKKAGGKIGNDLKNAGDQIIHNNPAKTGKEIKGIGKQIGKDLKDASEKVKHTHNDLVHPQYDQSGPCLTYEMEAVPQKLNVEKYLDPEGAWDKNPNAAEQEDQRQAKERGKIENYQKMTSFVFSLVKDGSFAMKGAYKLPVTWVGVDIGEFVLGKIFDSYKPKEKDHPNPFSQLFTNLTMFSKNFFFSQKLKDDMATVASVYQNIQEYVERCKKQDNRNVLHELNRPQGILDQLNKIKNDPDTSLSILLNSLSTDEDLKEGKAYENRAEYDVAYNKLLILGNAIGAYLLSIKTLIVFENTSQALKGENPFSIDYAILYQETEKWKNILTDKVAHVRKRRLSSVVDTSGRIDYLVYVKCNLQPEDFDKYLDKNQQNNNKARTFGAHYGITRREIDYGGIDVKKKTIVEFVIDNGVRREIDGSYFSHYAREIKTTPGWGYDGFKDKAADHDDTVFCFMQDCDRTGHFYPMLPFSAKSDNSTWFSRRRTADLYKKAYIAALADFIDNTFASFNELIKTWEEAALKYKYELAFPIDAPNCVKIQNWEREAPIESLWAQKNVQLRYGIRYKNNVGESADITWTSWMFTFGKAHPKLENLPVHLKDFGDLPVSSIKLYRQFKTSLQAQPSDEEAELLKIFIRDPDTNDFPSSYVDTKIEIKIASVAEEKPQQAFANK